MGKKPRTAPIGRSENMRRIRSQHTRPELQLRSGLHKSGHRYRIHVSLLPGKPDIVFKSGKLAIFVHGCFWHQHEGCREASSPRTNSAYWKPKLERNVERDARQAAALAVLGYKVLIFWECEIERDVDSIVETISRAKSARLNRRRLNAKLGRRLRPTT
jgi:DNA mismatch endonuclease (patch repair protein)